MKLREPASYLRKSLSTAVSVALLVVLALIILPPFAGCPKKAAEPAMGPPPGMMMSGPPPGEVGKGAKAAFATGGPGPGGPGAAPPPPAGPLDKNAYYSSTYLGGQGDRDRIEKLINDGVIVGGKTVKLAAFTRQYSQAFQIPTSQALSVQVDPEQSKLPQEGGEVHLQIGLQAIKREAPRRPPINLCLLIDRSGSMSEQDKLTYAKKAAADVIDGLSKDDSLSIVAYDERQNVLMPAARLSDKNAAKAKVATLSPGGSTDIHAALQVGYAQLKHNFSKEGINQLILLSDGNVTAGIGEPAAFRRLVSDMADGDIQTSSVGMGMDFDESLMMDVAQSGRGNYHFIKDAAQTQEIFQTEVGRLTRAVAKGVKLRVVLPQGVELVRVLGSSALSETEAKATRRTEQKIDQKVYDDLGIRKDRSKEDEAGIKMLIPHFYAGDSHVVMLQLRVPRGTNPRRIASVEVKYKDLVFKQNREVTKSADIGYTRDKSAVIASTNQAVKKNLLGFKTGEALLKAGEFIRQGRTGEAARAVDEQMVVLGVAAREWHDKDLDRDGQLLDRYKTVIASAGSRSIASTDLGNYLAKSLSYSGYELTR